MQEVKSSNKLGLTTPTQESPQPVFVRLPPIEANPGEKEEAAPAEIKPSKVKPKHWWKKVIPKKKTKTKAVAL